MNATKPQWNLQGSPSTGSRHWFITLQTERECKYRRILDRATWCTPPTPTISWIINFIRASGLVSWFEFKEIGSNSHLEVKARTRKTAQISSRHEFIGSRLVPFQCYPAHPEGAPFVSLCFQSRRKSTHASLKRRLNGVDRRRQTARAQERSNVNRCVYIYHPMAVGDRRKGHEL